jgi:hypothetical protein
MAVVLILVGVLVLVGVSSIIGARRNTPMAFEPTDPNIERAHAEARYLHDGLGPHLGS